MDALDALLEIRDLRAECFSVAGDLRRAIRTARAERALQRLRQLPRNRWLACSTTAGRIFTPIGGGAYACDFAGEDWSSADAFAFVDAADAELIDAFIDRHPRMQLEKMDSRRLAMHARDRYGRRVSRASKVVGAFVDPAPGRRIVTFNRSQNSFAIEPGCITSVTRASEVADI